MNLLRLFFSFRGRASRGGFWLVSLTWGALGFVLDYVWAVTGLKEVQVGENHLVDAAFVLPLLALFVSCLAVSIKRLHDRNRRGWWMLLFYVAPPAIQMVAPLDGLDSAVMVSLMVLSGAITVWALIALGCLPGTRGPNRYGPDPLAPGTARGIGTQ